MGPKKGRKRVQKEKILKKYDPEKIIPGWVACEDRGFVYIWNPEKEKIEGEPLDQDQPFEEWLRMVGQKDYPSARVIGAPWQKALQKSGKSQREIALISGLSESTISRLLAGEHIPGQRTLIKLSKALSIPISKLI